MNRVKWLLLGVAAFVFTGPSMFALDTSSFTPPPIKPPSPQQMAGGYWRTEGSFRPILRITNYLVNQTLLVTPVLYMADGTEYDLTPITLPAAETTGVDIIDALNKMPASLRSHVSEYGSAGVKYMWSWSNALTAMVQNLDVPRSLNFNFVLHTPMNMPGTPVSSQAVVREGMWWREDDGVEGFVAISNLSERTLSIRVQVRPSGIAAVGTVQDVQLGPHQTARLQLDFGEGKTGGVRITYKGFEHDVVLAGGLENDSEGYSAQIPFVLVDNTTAATDIGVGSTGLMNGAPDPMMMFPDGTIFHMYFALRNVSSLTVAVTPTLYYMAGGTAKSVTLANLLLPAGQTRLWNGDELLHKAGLDGLTGSLNVVFTYHSRPTDVLIATGSLDQSKTYVFEVEPQRLGTGSSRLLGDWSVADGNDTMISLLNPASRAHDISLTLYFAGGKYVLSLHLAPGESKMFNVSEIIMMSQSSGSNQPAIPAMITQGSAQMFGQAETNPGLGVIVSIAVFNVRTATCGNHCPNCFGYTGDVYISCLSCVVAVGQTATFADYALGQNGIWLNITNGSDWGATTWSVQSGNVTKTGFGTFLANGVGNFGVGATTTVNAYPNDCPTGSHGLCPPILLVPTGGGTAKPTISGPNTLWWFKGLTLGVSGYATQLTLTASAGTSYQWGILSGYDKISLPGSNQTSTQQVNSIGQSVTANDVSVTVAVNGITSDPFRLTVRAPYALGADSQHLNPVYLPDSTYAWVTDIYYVVVDNFLVPLPVAVDINENWNSPLVHVYPGENWVQPAPNSLGCGMTTASAELEDTIYGERSSRTPTPVYNANPSGQLVQYWGQEWRVGSCITGYGPRVETDILQKYTDHAAYSSVVTPAP